MCMFMNKHKDIEIASLTTLEKKISLCTLTTLKEVEFYHLRQLPLKNKNLTIYINYPWKLKNSILLFRSICFKFFLSVDKLKKHRKMSENYRKFVTIDIDQWDSLNAKFSRLGTRRTFLNWITVDITWFQENSRMRVSNFFIFNFMHSCERSQSSKISSRIRSESFKTWDKTWPEINIRNHVI